MAEGINRYPQGPWWAVLSMQDDGPRWIVGNYKPKGREVVGPIGQEKAAESACDQLNEKQSGFEAFLARWNANPNNPKRPVTTPEATT
jgi:hypothetical protein